MKTYLLVLALIGVSACGGSPIVATPPPAPVPIPSAHLISTGGGTWTACTTVGCIFNGPMRNDGAGCGNAVRGTIAFNNSANQPVGTYQWSISAATVIRPGEAFVFSTGFGVIPLSVSNSPGTYLVTPAWTDVRC